MANHQLVEPVAEPRASVLCGSTDSSDPSAPSVQVERLVDRAPRLQEVWVSVPGYAQHHQLISLPQNDGV